MQEKHALKISIPRRLLTSFAPAAGGKARRCRKGLEIMLSGPTGCAIIGSPLGAVTAFTPEAARWRYLGEETGLSPIYGGIHYPSDERAGNQMGKRLGMLAIQRDQLNGQ
jgi:hypothetical protein